MLENVSNVTTVHSPDPEERPTLCPLTDFPNFEVYKHTLQIYTNTLRIRWKRRMISRRSEERKEELSWEIRWRSEICQPKKLSPVSVLTSNLPLRLSLSECLPRTDKHTQGCLTRHTDMISALRHSVTAVMLWVISNLLGWLKAVIQAKYRWNLGN